MGNRKPQKLEPLPRLAFLVVGTLGAILVALVLVSGKFYLANWRGDMLFLPVALFLALVLVATVVRWLTKKN